MCAEGGRMSWLAIFVRRADVVSSQRAAHSGQRKTTREWIIYWRIDIQLESAKFTLPSINGDPILHSRLCLKHHLTDPHNLVNNVIVLGNQHQATTRKPVHRQ